MSVDVIVQFPEAEYVKVGVSSLRDIRKISL